MNKEKILDVIKELKIDIDNKLAIDEIKKTVSKEIEELKDEEIVQRIEKEELENKIADDNNYLSYYRLYDEAALMDLENSLNSAKLEQEKAKNAIVSANENKANAIATIANSEEEIRTINEKNENLGRSLRFLGINPDLEKEKAIKEELEENRLSIKTINNIIARNNDVINESNKTISGENVRVTSSDAKIKEIEEEYENYRKISDSRPLTDENKRDEDKKKLETLITKQKAVISRERLLSSDYNGDLDEIAKGLEEDTLTINEAGNKLENIKNNLGESLFYKDIENRNEELVDNVDARKEIEMEIERLKAKLNDPKQYEVSQFIIERNNAEIARWDSIVSGHNLAKSNEENKLVSLKQEQVNYNNKILECRRTIAEKDMELKKLKPNIEPSIATKIREDIATLRKNNMEYADHLVTLDILYNETENTIVVENEKLTRSNNILNNLKNSLEKKNSINFSDKRLDEIKLASEVASLVALKNRAEFISKPILEKLDDVIKEAKENIVEQKNEKDSFEEPLPFDEKLVNPEEVKNTEKEPIQNNENSEVSNDLAKGDIENTLVQDDVDYTKDNSLTKLGKVKAAYHAASDSLKAKARDKGFKKKLAKWAAAVMAVVTFITVGGRLMKVPNDVMEDLNKKDVIEQIEENSYDIEDLLEKNKVKEEIKIEPVQPVIEEVPVTPTPNYDYSENNYQENNYQEEVETPTVEAPNLTPETNPEVPVEDIVPDAEISPIEPESPEEDIIIRDETPEDKVENPDEKEEITDNADEIENPGDEDITIEDAIENPGDEDITIEDEIENPGDEDITVEDNVPVDSENPGEIYDNEDEITSPEIEKPDFSKPGIELPIVPEPEEPGITLPVEPPVYEKEGTSITITNDEAYVPGEIIDKEPEYGVNPTENTYTNVPDNITEYDGTISVEEKNDTTTVTVDTESSERDHEMTPEELKELRELFANSYGNETIEDEPKTK
ncbi:MAG: hypothetical protein RSH78_03585 [Bacilli bacterium]